MVVFNSKKAAMFGLDARIALAIFGALSVITGAALYSAIQQSKVVSIITQAEEVTKAYEAYLLDTGSPIRKVVTIDAAHVNKMFALYAKDLFEDSGISGWNGPYTSLKSAVGYEKTSFSTPNAGYTLLMIDSAAWGGATAMTACTNNTSCEFWIQVGARTEEMANAIDVYIDGSISPSSGKARIKDDSKNNVFIKTGIMYTGF